MESMNFLQLQPFSPPMFASWSSTDPCHDRCQMRGRDDPPRPAVPARCALCAVHALPTGHEKPRPIPLLHQISALVLMKKDGAGATNCRDLTVFGADVENGHGGGDFGNPSFGLAWSCPAPEPMEWSRVGRKVCWSVLFACSKSGAKTLTGHPAQFTAFLMGRLRPGGAR